MSWVYMNTAFQQPYKKDCIRLIAVFVSLLQSHTISCFEKCHCSDQCRIEPAMLVAVELGDLAHAGSDSEGS